MMGSAIEKKEVMRLQALSSDFYTDSKLAVVRVVNVMKTVTATVRNYEDLESDAERAPLKAALIKAVAHADATLRQLAVTGHAVKAVETRAVEPREFGQAPTDFDAVFASALAKTSAGAEAIIRGNVQLSVMSKSILAVSKVASAGASAEEGDEIIAVGTQAQRDSKLTCPIMKKVMVEPLTTPCGHTFSTEGLTLVSKAGKLGNGKFNCPQAACSKQLTWAQLVRDEALEDELVEFTQKLEQKRKDREEEAEEEEEERAGAGKRSRK
jgi:hypothetical protein